tara:strand:- start:684 stop:1997 length:1314 start_codon:yes stop_codon:yes gene_type:complete
MGKILKSLNIAKIIFILVISVFSLPSHATTNFYQELEMLASRLPEIRETLNKIKLSELEKNKISIAAEPSLNFSTLGNYPILSNLKQDRSRANNKDSYLDGKLTFNFPLYDFGEIKFQMSAEEMQKRALEIEFEKLKQTIIFEIIKDCIDIIKSNTNIQLLQNTIKSFEDTLALAKLRYTGGTGTLTSVRRLNLLGFELITELKQTKFELDLQKKSFLRRYKTDSDTYINLVKYNLKKLQIEPKDLKIENLSFIKKNLFETKALDANIQAIEASRWPSLDLKLTGTFYETENNFISENELLGGVELSMPLYDANLRSTQIDMLSIEKNILLQNRQKTKRDIQLAFRENKTSLEKLLVKQSDNKQKINEIQESLKGLNFSSNAIRTNDFEIASLELQRQATLRQIALYKWDEKFFNLENALITETLTETLVSLVSEEK